MTYNQEQLNRMSDAQGFIAALDQSGGSTPKALKNYGVDESAYSNDEEMFACVHEMRARIITSPAFNGEKILGTILFEKTMDGKIEGIPTAQYLWDKLNVIPFLKVDQGLANEKNGVQLMKAMPELDKLLTRAKQAGVFGTKMRSVIKHASEAGIADIVKQQFEIGAQIIGHGLVPIIEPEIDIHAADKAECEDILKTQLLKHVNALADDQKVMLKLTLPEQDNLYRELIAHKNVVRVVALSGGYDIEEACTRLGRNDGMIASFSRALSNDLQASQSDVEFNQALQTAIDKIYNASVQGKQASQAAE